MGQGLRGLAEVEGTKIQQKKIKKNFLRERFFLAECKGEWWAKHKNSQCNALRINDC